MGRSSGAHLLKLAHTSIISSVLVAEGPISASGGFGNLPAADWNGKYEQVGSGGWAGAIPTSVMIDPPDRLIGRGTVVGDSSKVMTRPLWRYTQARPAQPSALGSGVSYGS